jgi:hypothetical protein
MANRIFLPAILVLSTTLQTVAQTVPPPNSAKSQSVSESSAEMKQIFLQDQYDRGNNPYSKPGEPEPKALPGTEMRRNDDARGTRVKELLQQGLLHTGTDYYRAAMVFQHSGNPEGTLRAHVLAEVALSKGEAPALWLAAATLDRYLAQIKQKQIFGTQFHSLPRTDETKPILFLQDDLDPAIVSDPLRGEFCVKPFVKQEQGIPASSINSGLTPCLAEGEMKNRSNH